MLMTLMKGRRVELSSNFRNIPNTFVFGLRFSEFLNAIEESCHQGVRTKCFPLSTVTMDEIADRVVFIVE